MIKNGETVEFKKENRRAVIIEETHYVVKMYVGDELAEERPMYGKSKRYAEDCAENWENGIIKN
jgi:hypothetical protein